MHKKILKFITVPMILIFLFVACTPVDNDNGDDDQEANDRIISSLEEEIRELSARNQELEDALANGDPLDGNGEEDDHGNRDDSDAFLMMAFEVMEDIKDKDFDDLSDVIGEDGLLFSPYGHVDRENAVVLSEEEVENLNENNEEYQWGNYDGSGEEILLNFSDYYEEFIYDQDFVEAEIIGNNVRIGEGNTLENIHEVFENSRFVEFHFSGFDEEFEGMDWVSLRLVFTENGDAWNLVAIVHDQWTI